MPRMSMQFHTFRFSTRDPAYLSFLLQAFHIPRPSQPPPHNHPQVQSKNLPFSKKLLEKDGHVAMEITNWYKISHVSLNNDH